MAIYKVEVTDTFGGKRNYCWLHRHILRNVPEGASQATIVRLAKAAEGWTGQRCDTTCDPYGTGWEVKPRGACMLMDIEWIDDEEAERYIDGSMHVNVVEC